MSKPSRKRHPAQQPRFRRRVTYRKITGPYGESEIEALSGDAPLSAAQALLWRWIILAVIALGIVAVVVWGR